MKIVFISDIHGSLSFAKKAVTAFENEAADLLVVLGDTLYHGPRNPLPDAYAPADVATLLNQYKEKIIAIRGNCDSEVDQMLIEYPMMETYSTLFVDGRRFFLTHGHVYDPENHPELPAGSVFAYGHVHLPVAEKQNEIYVLNPGSTSLPKQENPNSYGVYDNNTLQVKTFDGEVIKKCILD